MKRDRSQLLNLFLHSLHFKSILLFSPACCIMAVSLVFFAMSIGRPYMSVSLSTDARGWTVKEVGANGLASQAGIVEGDKPIEVNGQPADMFLKQYDKSGLVFGTAINQITVVDRTGQLKSASLNGEYFSLKSMSQQISWLFVSMIFWSIGFYVLWKRPEKTASLLLCLIGVFFGLMLSSNMMWAEGAEKAMYIEVFAASVGPWLLLHFFLTLPEERHWLRKNLLIISVYAPAIITMVLFVSLGQHNDQPVQWFRTIRLFEAAVGLAAAVGVAIFNYFGAASIKTRQQMKIMLFFSLVAFVPFMFLYLIPHSLLNRSLLDPQLNILFITFIPVGMGYAIVTHKLMDIDIIIRRGLVYGLVTSVMTLILVIGILFAVIFEKSLGTQLEVLLALALGIIASALFGPVKNKFEAIIDRLFYKDRYDYGHIIQSLSTSLNSVNELIDVSRLVVGTSVNTLNLSSAYLFAKVDTGPFELVASQGVRMDAVEQEELLNLISRRSPAIEFPSSVTSVLPTLAFLIPLVEGGKKVGVLCVSQKSSRQDFSSNDMYLLQGISSVAATSLHRAILAHDVSMRDTFVSVASHELRTPLTSIVGYADLLLKRDPPDETKKVWLKNIVDSGERLSDMVDDLLNVSRIQSGKVNITFDKVDLADVFEEVVSFIRESTTKHELILDIESSLPNAVVDRQKFSQILGNLLSNAVKYSPNGGRITLSARNEPSGHCIVVSVKDQGIGIGTEDREALFKTFHRIQRPETQGIRGSGLGLYIAKEWTEAMGGRIWLESELNKGSTFYVAVPTDNSNATA